MRHVAWFLPFVTRFLAICAVLAELGAGLLDVIGALLVCVDSRPTRYFYVTYLGPSRVRLMTPCVVLEVLAVAVFLLYCRATRQARRAGIAVLVLLVGGLVGIDALDALDALLLHAQATLPSATSAGGEVLVEGPVEAWGGQWAGAILLVVSAWMGALAYLQWRR
jgi:hypothetical protein